MGTIYATTQNLYDVGIRKEALSNIEPEAITAALTTASATCDSYMAKRFEFPLTSFSPALTMACAKIAVWELLSVRGYNPGTPQGELLKTRYDQAIGWLKDVAAGKATPAYPDQTTRDGFNPQQQPFVEAPAQGGIGLADGSSLGGTFTRAGAVGPPKSRGW